MCCFYYVGHLQENVVKILEMTDVIEEAKDLQKAAEQFIVDNRKHLTPQLKTSQRGGDEDFWEGKN